MKILTRIRQVKKDMKQYTNLSEWFDANMVKAETPTLKALFVKIGDELEKRGEMIEDLEEKKNAND